MILSLVYLLVQRKGIRGKKELQLVRLVILVLSTDACQKEVFG